MGLGLYGNGMHDFVMSELEVGFRTAMAQDSENCGWSALWDLSYAEYCRTHPDLEAPVTTGGNAR